MGRVVSSVRETACLAFPSVTGTTRLLVVSLTKAALNVAKQSLVPVQKPLSTIPV